MHLGIDIGGTTIKGGIVSPALLLSNKQIIDTMATKEPTVLINQIIDFIANYLQQNEDVETIGVGVPGVVDSSGKVIVAPNLKDWFNIPLGEILRNHFSKPLAIDNDANCGAIAELIAGIGKSYEDFLYVTLGTGVGGAIISERKLFRGSIGGAGEFGHIFIHSDYICNNNLSFQANTLESFLGSRGIVSLALNNFNIYKDTKLKMLDNLTVKDISNYADLGDELSIFVMQKSGFYLGIGLSSIMNLLDIPNVIIGGGLSKATDYFFDSCRNTIAQYSLPSISQRVVLSKAKYEEDSGIMGAALLGLHKHLTH